MVWICTLKNSVTIFIRCPRTHLAMISPPIVVHSSLESKWIDRDDERRTKQFGENHGQGQRTGRSTWKRMMLSAQPSGGGTYSKFFLCILYQWLDSEVWLSVVTLAPTMQKWGDCLWAASQAWQASKDAFSARAQFFFQYWRDPIKSWLLCSLPFLCLSWFAGTHVTEYSSWVWIGRCLKHVVRAITNRSGQGCSARHVCF